MGRLVNNLAYRVQRQCPNLGFTAIVDKQLSAKYETLVSGAPDLIKALPWGKDFEVDVFRKPDFTALEILSFATGGEVSFGIPSCSSESNDSIIGIPAGINVSKFLFKLSVTCYEQRR